MSPRLYAFRSGVTQGNEDEEPVQDFVSFFWCKSGELGGKRSPRFPRVALVVESFSSGLLQAIITCWAESHLESVKHPRWSFFVEIANGLNMLSIFAKKCPTADF